ncbi:MAG: hypothetical protein PHQ46_01075 [Negativicutes bacterium]|nr:hypothetical protein [Negativicutes bacterium]
MHSSNRKFFIRLTVFLVGFFIIERILAFLLIPAYGFTRWTMHDFYAQEKNIDIAFVGASHTYQSFDPAIFDSKLGINSFNLGSSNQTPQDSYYIIKELLSIYKPKQIIYEITYPVFLASELSQNHVMTSLVIYDYFAPSQNKMEYFFHAFKPDNYADVFFHSYRYRSKFNFRYMKNTLAEKMNATYRRYLPFQSGYFTYGIKGFVVSSYQAGDAEMARPLSVWDDKNKNEEGFFYLQKIIEICKQENIELVLVTAPMPKSLLADTGNYQQAHDFFARLAEEEGLEYYDFCLLKPDIAKFPNSYFRDKSHLNNIGADKFSNIFAEFLLLNQDDRRSYFLTSFDEL